MTEAMDIEIHSVEDIGLQIQLTTLQLVISTLGARISSKLNEILAIQSERGFRFGAEVEIEILRIELRGAREAEEAVVELFKSIAKKGNLDTVEKINDQTISR
jgi:hypothetical protein